MLCSCHEARATPSLADPRGCRHDLDRGRRFRDGPDAVPSPRPRARPRLDSPFRCVRRGALRLGLDRAAFADEPSAADRSRNAVGRCDGGDQPRLARPAPHAQRWSPLRRPPATAARAGWPPPADAGGAPAGAAAPHPPSAAPGAAPGSGTRSERGRRWRIRLPPRPGPAATGCPARSRSPGRSPVDGAMFQSAAGSSTQASGSTVTATASPGRARAGVGPVTRSTTSEPSRHTW